VLHALDGAACHTCALDQKFRVGSPRFPYPTPDLQTLLPSALVVGTSGSSGSLPARQVAAVPEVQGKADWEEDGSVEVVAGWMVALWGS